MFKDTNVNVYVYGINETQFVNNNITTYNFIEKNNIVNKIVKKIKKVLFKINPETYFEKQLNHLNDIIFKIQPDIIHTLGLEDAGQLILNILNKKNFKKSFIWVHTFRGGPELKFLKHPDQIIKILNNCDSIICDNKINYKLLQDYNINQDKLYMKIIPGTGGVYIDKTKDDLLSNFSDKRVIIIPKAYECSVSKILPIFEAIKNIWPYITPCKIIITAASDEAKMWFETMPQDIKACTVIYDRIKREDFLDLLSSARVMIAPSLIDGIPNVLYESMALGVAPIVSPIETLVDDFIHLENVFYARNLYVNELEESLKILMNDNSLVKKIISNNFEFVSKNVNKKNIGNEILLHYHSLLNNIKE